jgi:hypothetical protein
VKRSFFQVGVLLVISFLASGVEAKKSLKANTDASQKAVSALLAVSDEPIPAGSTCHGVFGGEGPPRVRDLLAMELATFSRGKNTLVGACKVGATGRPQACQVTITHEFGEEASSAQIRFDAIDGHAVPASLDCRLTP